MADPIKGNQGQGVQPAKLEYGETQPPRNDVKEQRGGPQDNQITGQTEKGAHDQNLKERNQQGDQEP
jgi:hypothetical protein